VRGRGERCVAPCGSWNHAPRGRATVLPRCLYRCRRSCLIPDSHHAWIPGTIRPVLPDPVPVPRPAGAKAPRGEAGSTAHDGATPARAVMAAGRACRALWKGCCIVVRSVVVVYPPGGRSPP
jgi:hypothetical protein